MHLVIKIPRPMNYVNALKCGMEQTETNGLENSHNAETPADQQEARELGTGINWLQKPSSGPIKGFTPKRVFNNLDLFIWETWEDQV